MTVTRYIGDALVVEVGGADVGGEITVITVNDELAGPERIEYTDKAEVGGGRKGFLGGLRGEPKATITIECSDTKARASAVKTQLLSSVGAGATPITWYPEGKYRGNGQYSCVWVELVKKEFKAGYGSRAGWTLVYEAWEEVTEGAYEGPEGDAENGTFVISVADGKNTAYTKMFLQTGVLKWPAVVFLPTAGLDTGQYLTTAQCQQLGNATNGWDICGHQHATGMSWSDFGGDTIAYRADLAACRAALLGLGTPGHEVFGPPADDIDATAQACILDYFTRIVCGASNPYAVPPPGYTWDWIGCADGATTIEQITAKMDLCIGDRDRVLVHSFHTIVDSGPTGVQASVARVTAVLDAMKARRVRIRSLTQLEAAPA